MDFSWHPIMASAEIGEQVKFHLTVLLYFGEVVQRKKQEFKQEVYHVFNWK